VLKRNRDANFGAVVVCRGSAPFAPTPLKVRIARELVRERVELFCFGCVPFVGSFEMGDLFVGIRVDDREKIDRVLGQGDDR